MQHLPAQYSCTAPDGGGVFREEGRPPAENHPIVARKPVVVEKMLIIENHAPVRNELTSQVFGQWQGGNDVGTNRDDAALKLGRGIPGVTARGHQDL